MNDVDPQFFSQVSDLAVQNVLNDGGPFGALVIKDGSLVAPGVNRVTFDLDPTAHAEVNAIRNACQKLKTFDLSGCTLITSTMPCPMCASSCLWARLDKVIYLADKFDAAKAGFDDAHFYNLLSRDPHTWEEMIVEGADVSAELKNAPFVQWKKKDDKIEY